MSKEIARRDFLKAAAAGAAGFVAAGALGGVTAFAEEEKETGLPFEGKKKFAGIGSCRMVTDDIVYIGVSDASSCSRTCILFPAVLRTTPM